MAYATTTVFGPTSQYKESLSVIGRVTGADTVQVQLELDVDDWETVYTIEVGSDNAVRVFNHGERIRVVPSGAASFTVLGL